MAVNLFPDGPSPAHLGLGFAAAAEPADLAEATARLAASVRREG